MTSKIRVLRLIPVLDFGGVETTFELLASHIDRERFDLRICTFWRPGASAERIREAGVPVDVLGVNPALRNLRATVALVRYLRRITPHVVHSAISEANAHLLVSRPFHRCASIVEEVGVPQRSPRFRRLMGLLYRTQATRMVAVSEATRRYLIEEEGAPEQRVDLIYNGIAEEYYRRPVQEAPPRPPFIFAMVGRLEAVKNHSGVLEALRLARQRADIRLRIVGDGSLRPSLERMVGEAGLADAVSFEGYVSDIADVYDRSHGFVLASHSEGFGIAAVEAMARRRPGICSDVGALAEIVGSNSPWLVSPSDVSGIAERMVALATLEPEGYAQVAAEAQRAALPFQPEHYVGRLEALYREVAALG